ncbi:hypothetical protein CY652_11275 [Burkholderia sp. WAC0059]|uniref:hypothetical protein n=1 Tax=Burkholderia sp. WAC0059 TaxID=2066022 RepID=UPI000C7F6C93|nr:hypothetical protein [Burkholderia sp. WAC0059]PLZ02310.1 hypothetical protein CY652_11275 [Burkholderia sp. WAC0059]
MSAFLDTRFTRAALNAARPARRHLVRALRHHAARSRALAAQVREAKPVDGMRAWFRAFFSVLRVRAGARHFSLRTLMHRPATPLRAPTSPAPADDPSRAPRGRRPRRTVPGGAGWFAFAMR